MSRGRLDNQISEFGTVGTNHMYFVRSTCDLESLESLFIVYSEDVLMQETVQLGFSQQENNVSNTHKLYLMPHNVITNSLAWKICIFSGV